MEDKKDNIDQLADKIIGDCEDNDTLLEKILNWLSINNDNIDNNTDDNTEINHSNNENTNLL